MAWLEKRAGRYRIVFRFAGARLSRSLKTKHLAEARGALARLEDNLRRVELGILCLPAQCDPATFLLSDGKANGQPALPAVRTLHQLFESYFARIPAGSLEESTVCGMRIHARHLERLFGRNIAIAEIDAGRLQGYIERRARGNGRHGRSLSPATIKKELITLRTVWNRARTMGLIEKPFPGQGLKFPKLDEKTPFLTLSEAERRIERAGLTPDQVARLWDSVFLSLPEIDEVLGHVRSTGRHPFLYPMFVFAAHTGARRIEILRSEIDDFDFASGTVLIRERKRIRGKRSTRRVPLSDRLNQAVKDWLDHHPGGLHTFVQNLDVPRSKKKRQGFGPLTRHEAHDHFKRTLAKTRWSKLSGWHVFRHSFCSNCAASGVDQRVINAWVGHQTEEMVQRYRHLLPNQQHDAMRLVFGS